MSIKTTRYITKKVAIERLKEIANLYLENVCNKPIQSSMLQKLGLLKEELVFNKEEVLQFLNEVDGYDNELLGNLMDLKYFSFSEFENYIVED